MKNRLTSGIGYFFLLLIQIGSFGSEVNAQTSDQFIPHGKPQALIFSDVNYTFNKAGDSKSFEVTRAYLGYEYSFSSKITSRITFDVADPGVGGLQMIALLKFALVQYKSDKFSARFGMIPTDQFSLQESIWGYRYIAKSFQDVNKFGPSSDLGAAAEFAPSKLISFDISILNGEGYKKVQIDSSFKASAGVTLKPAEGLFLRAYYDYLNADFSQSSAAFFIAYTKEKLKIGAEYNLQKNNEMKNGHDFSGYSVFSSYRLAEKFTVFARYDNLSSEIPYYASEPWNKSRDGKVFLAGFDYNPVKGVKIAPTISGYSPFDVSKSLSTKAGLYFEIRF